MDLWGLWGGGGGSVFTEVCLFIDQILSFFLSLPQPDLFSYGSGGNVYLMHNVSSRSIIFTHVHSAFAKFTSLRLFLGKLCPGCL